MRFRFHKLGALLAWTLVLTGCRTVPQTETAEASPSAAAPVDIEKRAEAHAHYLAGLSFEQNRDLDSALAEYEKALDGDPHNEDLAVELSRRYVQRKDFDKAADVLKKAADVPESSGLMFARLSLIYLQQGKTNAAIDASRTAIKRAAQFDCGIPKSFPFAPRFGPDQ